MPVQSIIVVCSVVAAFTAFGVTLAGVIAYTARDPRRRSDPALS